MEDEPEKDKEVEEAFRSQTLESIRRESASCLFLASKLDRLSYNEEESGVASLFIRALHGVSDRLLSLANDPPAFLYQANVDIEKVSWREKKELEGYYAAFTSFESVVRSRRLYRGPYERETHAKHVTSDIICIRDRLKLILSGTKALL